MDMQKIIPKISSWFHHNCRPQVLLEFLPESVINLLFFSVIYAKNRSKQYCCTKTRVQNPNKISTVVDSVKTVSLNKQIISILQNAKKRVMIFILNSMNNIMAGILLLRQYKNELPERSPLLYCLLHRVNNKALCFDTCAVKVPFAQNRVFL